MAYDNDKNLPPARRRRAYPHRQPDQLPLPADRPVPVRAGQRVEAEQSLTRSYELDAGNPLTAYNLSLLLFDRGELVRSQFYIRRLNNSELANSETLWLGIKIEQKLNNMDGVQQLATQLKRRFGQSKEAAAFDRRAFNE